MDFDSFRCDYFMAKNSKQTVFREWMKRNELNKKVITTYYDDFHLFQKKKINKENRKSKLLLRQTKGRPSTAPISDKLLLAIP